MERAKLNGVVLEYIAAGAGEPVVMIHGALIADSFQPLFSEPGLADQYRLIAYRRRGYLGSSPISGSTSIEQQASDCKLLLDRLGVDRAHVVGHSYGGVIALQLALDTPQLVQTLALLEPALITGDSAQAYQESLIQGQQRYQEVGAEVVVDEFLEMRFGGGYHSDLDLVLPGAFEQAVVCAGTPFEDELPALQKWRFDQEQARQITAPALAILGSESIELSPRFQETYEQLLDWLPNVEGCVLERAAHGIQMQNPPGTASILADFFRRHPISGPAR